MKWISSLCCIIRRDKLKFSFKFSSESNLILIHGERVCIHRFFVADKWQQYFHSSNKFVLENLIFIPHSIQIRCRTRCQSDHPILKCNRGNNCIFPAAEEPLSNNSVVFQQLAYRRSRKQYNLEMDLEYPQVSTLHNSNARIGIMWIVPLVSSSLGLGRRVWALFHQHRCPANGL